MDHLVRDGNSYAAQHGSDFLIANDPWFRGVELKYGPDGDVYLTDWSDLGECHDRDGAHRTSGRIYKIQYTGNPEVDTEPAPKLASASADVLVQLQLHSNDWYVRHARRKLQELAVSGRNLTPQVQSLRQMFDRHPDITRKLRAMWCLYCVDAAPEAWLIDQLDHPNEHVRLWASRLLVDAGEPSLRSINVLTELARKEQSSLVRLFLASAIQRLPLSHRWALAQPLCTCATDVGDRVQPLMLWYGIEPAVASDPANAISLARTTVFPLLRRHISRRLASQIDDHPTAVSSLLELAQEGTELQSTEYLEGIAAALRGRRKIDSTPQWRGSHAAIQSLIEPEAKISGRRDPGSFWRRAHHRFAARPRPRQDGGPDRKTAGIEGGLGLPA